MTDQRIPVAQIESGEKFVNGRGMRVIKDGIKASSREAVRAVKPRWLRMRMLLTNVRYNLRRGYRIIQPSG